MAGPCGLWPEDLGPSVLNPGYSENRPYHNFGCATQRNLAAMIDNPADLEQPRSETAAYTARRTEAFEKYRKGNLDHDHLSRSRQGQTQRYRQMISSPFDIPKISRTSPPPHADDYIAPAPRVSVQAFCETVATAAAVRSAAEDRRLGKAHLTVQMGGVATAIETYRTVPTPNVIILETEGGSDILAGLDELATVCDPGTRVVVIGTAHDAAPYRELVRRGVSDYVIGPVVPLDVVRSVCSLFSASEAIAVGRIIAVVGAKGGVGASTVAHNVAWAIARDLSLDSVVIDLDLAFGTAGLDYNKDPMQGIANAIFSPDRPDSVVRSTACWRNAPTISACWRRRRSLERVYDFGADAFDAIFDTLRMTTPCIVLDVPHQWSGWTKRVLVGADDILVVAEPDLANLRNTKNMLNMLKAARPNDRPPLYCLNQVGMPKRPEIERPRIRQDHREPADRFHSVRFADVRHRRQQRPDDRGNFRQSPHHQDVPADRAAADRPRRAQEAEALVPGAADQEAAGRVGGVREAAGGRSHACSPELSWGARRAATGSLPASRRAHCSLRDSNRLRSATFAAASSAGRSAFTMLSASARRPCRPTTSARFSRTRGSASGAAVGAAQDLLRLGQILCKDVGEAEIGQHGRLFRRDLQRAGIVLPRFLVSAELIEHGALRRQDPPIRIVGAVGAAEDVEGLLKIAVVRQRPPIAGEQRLVAGMSDGGLLEHGHRLGPSVPWRAAPCRIAAPRRHPWDWRESDRDEASSSRRGSAARLASVFSPSDPVMSEVPAVWQPHSPNARIADDAAKAAKPREAIRVERLLEHVSLISGRRLTRKCSQFNPKFRLRGGAPVRYRSRGANVAASHVEGRCRPNRRIERRIRNRSARPAGIGAGRPRTG